MKDVRKQVNWFIVCVVIVAISAVMVNAIQSDFGKVEVTQVRISNANGEIIVAKLFRPLTATADNKAPAILNMHGYQNDKDVQDLSLWHPIHWDMVTLAADWTLAAGSWIQPM
jgi:cephalosporin-C deacetylase-like acetyl esterase